MISQLLNKLCKQLLDIRAIKFDHDNFYCYQHLDNGWLLLKVPVWEQIVEDTDETRPV